MKQKTLIFALIKINRLVNSPCVSVLGVSILCFHYTAVHCYHNTAIHSFIILQYTVFITLHYTVFIHLFDHEIQQYNKMLIYITPTLSLYYSWLKVISFLHTNYHGYPSMRESARLIYQINFISVWSVHIIWQWNTLKLNIVQTALQQLRHLQLN